MENKRNYFVTILLALIAFICLIPFLWVVFSTFKTETEIQTLGYRFFPKTWTFQNIVDVLSDINGLPIMRWFLNSIIISSSFSILSVLLSSLSAFALARLNFKGRNLIFSILIASLTFPAVVNLIPNYKIIQTMGWLETPLAAIVPGLGTAFNIFLIRQFMKNIPREIDEAAKMDGASILRIYLLILPLTKPVLIVVGLFSFVLSWNDFLWPTIVYNNTESMTLAAGLRMVQGVYDIEIAHSIAAAFLSIIPTIVLYFVAQRYFLSGISLSSSGKE